MIRSNRRASSALVKLRRMKRFQLDVTRAERLPARKWDNASEIGQKDDCYFVVVAKALRSDFSQATLPRRYCHIPLSRHHILIWR